jgi:hypothetical protein
VRPAPVASRPHRRCRPAEPGGVRDPWLTVLRLAALAVIVVVLLS